MVLVLNIVKRTFEMTRKMIIPMILLIIAYADAAAQDSIRIRYADDTVSYVPRAIPDMLSPELFIPAERLQGLNPWMYAPMQRPKVHIVPVYGFSGYGFGKFTVDHFDKVFANLLGFNDLSVPQVIVSQQMMLGNTIALGKKRRVYFANGILYGRQFGVWGNMIGMGSREGLIFKPSGVLMITVWTQEYQSVYTYSPVVYAYPEEGTASIRLPASPVIVSYGAQAYFLAGQFWIGIGASVWTAAGHKE